MVNRDIGASKFAELADRVHRVRTHVPASPTELRGAFERLEQHGVITAATRRSLARAVGLRDVVAHGYGTVDAAMVHAGAVGGVRDLERYAQEVAAWMASRVP